MKRNAAKIYKVSSEADRKQLIDWSRLEKIAELVRQIKKRSKEK